MATVFLFPRFDFFTGLMFGFRMKPCNHLCPKTRSRVWLYLFFTFPEPELGLGLEFHSSESKTFLRSERIKVRVQPNPLSAEAPFYFLKPNWISNHLFPFLIDSPILDQNPRKHALVPLLNYLDRLGRDLAGVHDRSKT